MPHTPHLWQWGDPHSTLKLPTPMDQSPNTTTCPFDLPSQIVSISDEPFCHNALEWQTQRHRPTYGWRECSMTIGRFLSLYRELCSLIILTVISQVILFSCWQFLPMIFQTSEDQWLVMQLGFSSVTLSTALKQWWTLKGPTPIPSEGLTLHDPPLTLQWR